MRPPKISSTTFDNSSLKGYRQIGTRFEKLAISFTAMPRLAMIQRYLRSLSSDGV